MLAYLTCVYLCLCECTHTRVYKSTCLSVIKVHNTFRYSRLPVSAYSFEAESLPEPEAHSFSASLEASMSKLSSCLPAARG